MSNNLNSPEDASSVGSESLGALPYLTRLLLEKFKLLKKYLADMSYSTQKHLEIYTCEVAASSMLLDYDGLLQLIVFPISSFSPQPDMRNYRLSYILYHTF